MGIASVINFIKQQKLQLSRAVVDILTYSTSSSPHGCDIKFVLGYSFPIFPGTTPSKFNNYLHRTIVSQNTWGFYYIVARDPVSPRASEIIQVPTTRPDSRQVPDGNNLCEQQVTDLYRRRQHHILRAFRRMVGNGPFVKEITAKSFA
ncbi:Hypothetical protein CINCED_3A024509 [Cinara cedri]|uniref:Uncharacterized protein n=1 Tax=Cinara cedri TaxID=506608 RepID=A0A5E4NPM4_9HEMI|nr:Hypothetical protein CINCED_3A024509 [Cinara cedri]